MSVRADAQMLRVDDIRIADADGPLDDVFQFSDVPRPVVRKHLLDRLARELFRFQPKIPADLQQKLVDEQIQTALCSRIGGTWIGKTFRR